MAYQSKQTARSSLGEAKKQMAQASGCSDRHSSRVTRTAAVHQPDRVGQLILNSVVLHLTCAHPQGIEPTRTAGAIRDPHGIQHTPDRCARIRVAVRKQVDRQRPSQPCTLEVPGFSRDPPSPPCADTRPMKQRESIRACGRDRLSQTDPPFQTSGNPVANGITLMAIGIPDEECLVMSSQPELDHDCPNPVLQSLSR
jgi:hypothetical protein